MRIQAGTIWRHYKGSEYKILAVSKAAGSLDTFVSEPLVTYYLVGEPERVYTRKISEWLDEISDGKGETQRTRFWEVLPEGDDPK